MSATARVRTRAADSAPAKFLPPTKFQVPVVRADLVGRPGLLTALRPLDITRLVLVGAPAGSGKTTLLAQWARSPGAPAVAWVALDATDDDPILFWTCVLEALRRVQPGLGARVEGALDAGADLVEFVVPLLLDELVLLPRRTVLVLDDYHLIAAPEIHRSLARLIERLPPRHQIASRPALTRPSRCRACGPDGSWPRSGPATCRSATSRRARCSTTGWG